MEVPLFTQGFLFPFLKYSQAKTPFASVTCHKPEVFMLTGTFLAGKETKYKGAEGTGLWSNSKIIFTKNTN